MIHRINIFDKKIVITLFQLLIIFQHILNVRGDNNEKDIFDNGNEYIVNNADEFLEVLNALNDTRTIVVNGEFDGFPKEIKINPPTNNGSLKIRGVNRKTSALRFVAGTIGLTFSNLDTVEIENLTFRGRLNFKNLKELKVHDIDHIGLFDTSGTQEGGYVSIKNYNFTSNDGKTRTNSVKFNAGGSTFIEDSIFTASIGCTESIIKYNGRDCDVIDFSIKNSTFDCQHFANAIIIQVSNFTLESSQFYNGYSKKQGAFMTVRDSWAKISNCTFKDGYTTSQGGVFNTLDNIYFEASDLKVYNTTSYNGGGLFYEDSKYPENVSILRNIEYIDYWKGYPNNGRGSIINIYAYSNVIIENLYGEGFYCIVLSCTLFLVYNNSRAVIKNSRIDKVHGIENGIVFFVNSFNGNERAYVNAVNCTFSNLEIDTSRPTSIVWAEGSDIELENVHFNDIRAEDSSLVYAFNNGTIYMKNVDFENVYNANIGNAIFVETNGNIISDDVRFKNIFYNGAFIRSDKKDIALDNMTIENYNICTDSRDEKCIYEQNIIINNPETVFLRVDDDATISITNSTIKNFDLYTLFIYGKYSSVFVDNLNVDNGHFATGAVSLSDVKPMRFGTIEIKNSEFSNIYSENGPIINIENLIYPYSNKILFENTIFQNTEANIYGGVIYSLCEYANDVITFNDCKFINTKAKYGLICHSYSKNSEPVISNKDELISSFGSLAFTTNPIELEITDDTPKSFSILSGETLSTNIKFHLIDDYKRVITLDSNFNTMNLNDIIFFKIGTEDNENYALLGQLNGYCWEDYCETGDIKIVGNPGTYPIYIELITYGNFIPFNNSRVSLEITINECDTSIYHYQDKENSNFKSCYNPVCSPSCNNGGVCISDNTCECKDTNFRGKYCDERYILQRNKIMDKIIFSITIILIIIIISLIVAVIIFRDNTIIKAGSVDFMIIILVGLILNSLYTLCLTYSRNKFSCIFIFSFKNIGFSLVYSSILIKTYRIYKIFKIKTKTQRTIKKGVMYIFLLSVTAFHVLLFTIWLHFNFVDVETMKTNKEEEYLGCKYPKTELLSNILNISVIIIASMLSYSIRDVKKEFKEPLAVPVYVYLLVEILLTIINNQNEMSLLFKDIIQAFGSIISSITVLYYLYIHKFEKILSRKLYSNSNKKSKTNTNSSISNDSKTYNNASCKLNSRKQILMGSKYLNASTSSIGGGGSISNISGSANNLYGSSRNISGSNSMINAS